MYQTLEQLSGRPSRAVILNYGPPKTGKTRALSTLPRPIWVWDLDWGADSLVTVAKREAWKGDDLIVLRYTPPGGDKVKEGQTRPRGKEVFLDAIRDFNCLYDHLDPNDPTRWKEGAIRLGSQTFPRPPASIAFDGLSQWGDIILDYILNLGAHDLNAPKTDARADYGMQMGKIEETIISSASLPCNVVWNAHEVVDKDETTAQIRCDPYVTGKLAARIARHFGIVLYSTIRGGKYVWLTQPEGYIRTAGTRYKEGLPAVIEQDYRNVL